MRTAPLVIPLLLWLGSCASPPKPPDVDESNRRPANARSAVELQACRSDLQNTHLHATESARIAEVASANLQRLSARPRVSEARPTANTSCTVGNSIFTIRFEFASTRVAVPADIAPTLLESARAAPLVLVRGRTDGAKDTNADGRIARGRATAVRDFLVAAGVDLDRIRTSYQPTGDHAADNSTPMGRSMNRRVEVEVYRALPVAMNMVAVARP